MAAKFPISRARKDDTMNLRLVLFALLVAVILAVFVDTLTALAFAAFFTAMTQDLD